MGFDNTNLKLSEEDNKTKCKGGARWFFTDVGLSAVDMYSSSFRSIKKCLYTWNEAGHGAPVHFGIANRFCAPVVKEPVADNDGYFYLKVSGYYTRWNDTGLVLDNFGDLFYEDTGYPGNNITCPFQGHV